MFFPFDSQSRMLVLLGALAAIGASSADADSYTTVRDEPVVIDTVGRSTPVTTVRGPLPVRPSGPVDRKTFSGGFCKPDRGHDIEDVKYSQGAIVAQHDGWAVVECPIMRDNTTNSDGMVLTMFIESQSEPVGCTLFSRSPDGDELARHTITSTDWDETELKFWVSDSAHTGYYHLLCNLRAGAKIYSYTIAEYMETEYDG
ncbi:MAG: hypothetical protein AAF493_00800 [Pseudomonadota bacterium]